MGGRGVKGVGMGPKENQSAPSRLPRGRHWRKFFRGLAKWGLPLRIDEDIAADISAETRKVGAGAGMTTGSDLRSQVEAEDQTLRSNWSVWVFSFLLLGYHGMGYHHGVQGGSDDGDKYGENGPNLLRGCGI